MEIYHAHKKLIQKMSWAAKFECCCLGQCKNPCSPSLALIIDWRVASPFQVELLMAVHCLVLNNKNFSFHAI